MNYTSDEEGKKKIFNEINITPLTDIFLVLLIIMMVIAPSFNSVDSNIQMPEINSGLAIEQDSVTVSITKDGHFFVNERSVQEFDLENSLSNLVNSAEKKEVVVRADKSVKSSEIMKVMKSAQNAGFEKMVVAGEPLSKKMQKELLKNAEDEVKG